MHSIRYTRVANEKFMTQLSLIKKLTIKEDHSLFVISTNQIKELIMWSGVYDIIRQAHLLSRGGVSSTQSSSSPTSKTTLLILVTTPANNLGVRRKGRVQRGRLHWIFARWSIHSYPNTMLMVYTLEQDMLSTNKIVKQDTLSQARYVLVSTSKTMYVSQGSETWKILYKIVQSWIFFQDYKIKCNLMNIWYNLKYLIMSFWVCKGGWCSYIITKLIYEILQLLHGCYLDIWDYEVVSFGPLM